MPEPQSNNLPVLLIISAVLVVLSMIFSAAESAFLSVNKLRVRILQRKKNRNALRVWKLLKNKDKLINTLLVCNNIVNMALSSILTVVAITLFGPAGVGIATFISTVLLLIFGEISPKTVAVHNPEPIAFFFSSFIQLLEAIFAPLVFLFTMISRGVLKLFGVSASSNKVSYTEEEIKTFLEVGKEQGVLDKNEQSLMKKVFKFTDLEAKDIMIPRKNIKAISENSSYKEVIEMSQRFKLSKFPVYKKDIDDIVGIIYVKDILKYKTHEEDFSLKKVMRPPLFILETKKMSGIQEMLKENKQSMAIVIDEYSGTYGVLTVEDIVREIFGPVTDEFKPYARRVEVQIKNTKNAEVDGLSRLIDINEQLGTNLTSEYNETIGGLICEKTGVIPHVGDNVVIGKYKFIVSKMDENRVSRVRIREV